MRMRPKKSATAAAIQCAYSARGITLLHRLEIVDEAGRHQEREHQTDEDDEQRRLEEVVVQAQAPTLAVADHDAGRARDRPYEPPDHRQRAEELDCERAPRPTLDALAPSVGRDAGCDLGGDPDLLCGKVLPE